jgi:hypothetical protein
MPLGVCDKRDRLILPLEIVCYLPTRKLVIYSLHPQKSIFKFFKTIVHWEGVAHLSL